MESRQQRWRNKPGNKAKCALWMKRWYEKNKKEENRKSRERHRRNRNTPSYRLKMKRWQYNSIYGPNAFTHHVEQKRKQKGLCAICLEAWDKPNQDHNHFCCKRMGKKLRACGHCNRGILCTPCNTWLGFVEELLVLNPRLKCGSWFKKALRYLKEWSR